MKKNLRLIMLVSVFLITGLTNISVAFTSISDPSLYETLANMKIPLVVINTVKGEEPTCEVATPPPGAWGSGIQNATKVPASMQIIINGTTLYESGEYIKKESGLTVKIRGNTSGKKVKKPYKLKLQKKADLLLRGDKKYEDKDWVLLRTGRSLINPIGFWVSELIGQEWTPSHQIVNVFMNGTYRGLYVLCEQVSVNSKCRIDVDENEGYVVEADPYWWNEDLCFDSSLTVPELKFTYKYPDLEDLTDEWHKAISEDVLAHEAKISDATFDEVYDCESFAKWLLAWELLCNDDSAGGNMFIVKKDADSKICMGPIWDFDYALHWSEDWIGLHYKYFYFHHMLESANDCFRKAFYSLWHEHGWEVVTSVIEKINAFADSAEAIDYQRSIDIETALGFPYDWWQPYLGDLEYMRQYSIEFLTKRSNWIDAKMDEEYFLSDVLMDFSENNKEESFDLLGRSVHKDTPGLQIRGRKKIYVKP